MRLSSKIVFFWIGLWISFPAKSAIIPILNLDTLPSPSISIQDTIRDSCHKNYRKYTILMDTLNTSSLSGDSLTTKGVKDLILYDPSLIPPIRQKRILDPSLKYFAHHFWKQSLDGIFNFSETTFSPNWKAGGINSIALEVNLDLHLDYARRELSFTNEFQVQLGGFNSKGLGIRKSLDKLFIDSKIGYRVGPHIFLFSSANFQSQFLNGYTYFADSNNFTQKTKISGLLAPGYLTEALGLEYKPNAHFSARASLFSTTNFRFGYLGLFGHSYELWS
jgi:Protein of unknown function (DUF3078)